MLIQIIWISSILMSLTTISESTEFCQKFKENGNKISFIFRRMLVTPPARITFDLFIGKEYWRLKSLSLKSNDSTENFVLEFSDKDRTGRLTQLADEYPMGTAISGGSDFSQSMALFIKGSNMTFANIPNDDHKEEDKDLSELKEFAYQSLPDVEADFVISGLSRTSISSIEVIKKVSVNGINSLESTKFLVKSTAEPPLKTNSSNDNKEITVFKEFNTNHNIIGVHSMPDTALYLSILILMADGEKVLYCTTRYNQLMPRCKTPSLLIDCSSFGPTKEDPLKTSPQTTSSGSKTWILFVILAMVVLIVILIVAIFGFRLFSKSSSGKDEETLTKVLSKSKDSGLSRSKINGSKIETAKSSDAMK